MTPNESNAGDGTDASGRPEGVSSKQDEPQGSASGTQRPGRSIRLLGGLLLAASVAPTLLAIAATTGIGLEQNVPGQLAFGCAIVVVILPALGLAAALGSRAIAYGVSLALVSIAVVWALPSYFPERREHATETGFTYLSRGFGEGTQTRAVEFGRSLLGFFGPEPRPILRAERTDADARRGISAAIEVDKAEEVENRGATWIPYEGDGQTIIIPAHVDGPDFGEDLRFVFDTGATLTTISSNVLKVLDVHIPDDAPEVMLRTAAGEMKARLVLVDAIWLQQEVVEWVTVAVCEHCANDRADGLLGLNFSSHFRVSIDHEAGELEWVPRHGRRNRRLDIQPWLEMNSVLRRWDDGRLELEIRVENNAARGIKSSVLEVSCSDEQFTIHLDPIPGKGGVTQLASLPWGARCEAFEVVPVAAAWETDRF